MAVAHDFSKMVPGFDFLQGLVKNASSALPNLGQWVAPTLDPQELEKRIEELKTVQFWLEQNARMIATTVQALEVQRMTLSTLKTMNVQVADLAQAFKLKDPVPPAPAAQPAPATEPAKPSPRAARPAAAAPAAASGPAPRAASAAASGPAQAAAGAAPGVVDPMQWWGALTQQFTQLAAQAMKDGSVEAASQLAGAMVKNSAEAVGEAMKQAGMPPAAGAVAPAKRARQTVSAQKSQANASSASPNRPARKTARKTVRTSSGRTAKRQT